MANETMHMKTTGIEKREIALTSSVAGLTAELEAAMDWLRVQRRQAPPNADVWHLCHHWDTERDILKQQLAAGTCRLSPMQVVGRDKKKVQWGARDALVLKWLTQRLSTLLPVHPRCEHVKGHCGGRASVSRLSEAASSGEYRYVCRTDIRGYYGAINKATVLRQVQLYVQDPILLGLVRQYLHYTVEDGGEFYTPERGICRGCSLSPLLGALHLYEVDAHFSAQEDIVYARYMDDFVILAKSRWALRRQVRALNGYFAQYGFEQHPDKTFIGRVSRGLDWLGAWLDDTGVTGIAPRALANHRERVRRLYEQLRHWPNERRECRVSQYRARWAKWALLSLTLCAAPCHAEWINYGPIQIGASEQCVPKVIWYYSDYTPGPRYVDSYHASGVAAQDAGNNNANSAPLPTIPTDHFSHPTTTIGAPVIPGCPGRYGYPIGRGLYITSSYSSTNLHWDDVGNSDANRPNIGMYSAGWDGRDMTVRLDYMDSLAKKAGTWSWVGEMAWPSHISYRGLNVMSPTPGPFYAYDDSDTRLEVVWDGSTEYGTQTVGGASPPRGFYTLQGFVACTSCGSAPPTLYAAPVTTVTIERPRPVCTTSVDGTTSKPTSAVTLLPVDAACPGGVCSKSNTPDLARTTFQVTCTSPGGNLSAVVKPRLTFLGNLDPAAGNYLLKTTQSGVFLWGSTATGANGCNKWGSTAADMTGFAPFDGVTHWEPGWTDTSNNWSGTTWKSATATMNWGVCLDNSAGGRTIKAGPFTATATWTLHVD